MMTVVIGIAVAAWLPAQDALPPGYQSYTLRHASAVDLAPQVRDVISNAPGSPEVVVDKARNLLLVRGGDDAQRLAAQLISALDRPAAKNAPKTNDTKKAEAIVRGYRLPPGDNQRLLADLKRRYPESTGVNLAIDKRTGQLIAFAPSDVQRKLEEQLGEANTVDEAVRQPALQAPSKQVVQRDHTLKNITWQGVEAFLQRIWAAKAAVETNRSGEVASIRMRNLSGEEAIARIDRRTNEVRFEGSRNAADDWGKLISVLDGGPASQNESVQLVPVERADPVQLHESIELVKAALNQGDVPQGQQRAVQSLPGARSPKANELVAKIFQQEGQPPVEENADNRQPSEEPMPPAVVQAADEGGAIGPVRIEFLEGLDVVILTGNKRDVARVAKIIQEIQDISKETQPIIELYPMRNVDSTAVGELVVQLYNDSLAARFGRVSITALDKPNALLFIGRRNSIDAALDLVKKLDVPTVPQTQFKVIQLKYMAAADAGLLLTDFFAERETLGVKVKVSTEVRTNAVIIHGGPRDIQEAERLLASVDLPKSESENELRVFKLNNAMAADLAVVLQQAIAAQGGGVSAPGAQGQGQQGAQQGNQPQNLQQSGGTTQNQLRSSALTYMVVDREGNRLLESGLLNELRITADVNANALLVRGPARSMDLVAALIRELDRLPDISAQIKVFTIVNGDATSLMQMLQTLFGQATGAAGGQGGFFGQPVTAGGDNSLVPLRFSVDQRTNSIIASGAAGDLGVVEAILLRLDEGDIRQRKTTVYRLKNAPAIDVANAINQFLTSERQVQQLAPTSQSPFEQLEREVVVVPEAVSNSLIVSATPRFYDEIAKVVEDLDARPPMVMIQVLIAEVSLNDFEEFGAEFGLQDALLFDRSVINNAVAAPGYAFNNAPLANIGTNPALSDNLAGQSLTHFALGRTNGNLGYGGLVLSASNESISILIRALQDAQRLQVLSRPQVTTLDNQSAFVQVGQRVPYVQGTSNTVNGFNSQTTLINVGLLLGVTPRISPDGLVVMEIDAEKSELGPIDQGIPISFGPNGEVIRQPIINTTLAQTTVSARSGQTVILGGLITKTRGYSSRRVPYLSDIPILGRLFRYDSATEERTELLIIMTPHIVKTEADADWIKQVESDRMSWCLADVVEIHGDAGLSGGNGLWGPAMPPPIYPDVHPDGHPEEWIEPGVDVPPLYRGPTTPSGRVPGAAAPEEINPLPPPVESPTPLPASGAQSKRVPQKQRTGLKAASQQALKEAAPMPQYDNNGLRTERSDNATIYYAAPKPRVQGPVQNPPASAEVAPAYFQQPPSLDDRYQPPTGQVAPAANWQQR